ncbi:hypothetical protein DFQ29_005118 [Apophysomyces sp. BC1021]|nr:hypothetical protein DFQ29_005118 [Apophysomyces sp. BC1021]
MVRNGDWMYIRAISTGNVISASCRGDALRSQVYVHPPKQVDEELWRWEGKYLKNKATGLVLDIRKGRLRLIEDTEICLYEMKPVEEARNQLWGMRDDLVDALGRRLPGCIIHSVLHDDWVLDVQVNSADGEAKLILFPYQVIDNEFQRWSFVSDIGHSPVPSPNLFISPTVELSPSTSSSSLHDMPIEFVNGLTPAKRGSQSSMTGLSLDAYKESHQNVYVERQTRQRQIMAMAAAYHTWQTWKTEQQANQGLPDMVQNQRTRHEKTRARLQSTVRSEAAQLFDQCDQLNNHKETILSLASRYITQLYEQMPSSP